MELPNKFVFCPECGEKLDGATCVTDQDATPKEGDISICYKCGTILEYEEAYFVHKVSPGKLSALKILDEELYQQLIYIQQVIKQWRKIQINSCY